MSNIPKCTKCGLGHEPTETCEHVQERLKELEKGIQISKSGYGGVLSSGQIVDRREHPEAMPIQANSMFGIPKPKKITH